ncbi:lytic transglycosylase domain-containing protein [Pseudoxanthomonas suwonensis]|uniref:lytic transglycosylase domain-containing protein n=1 Tax=Pseudoxanthomonas suwonensis TaxID=314722 RepID=UPI00048BCA42|nr:lytic transglycosylase domain-containing protein [Pseudoxanthomonas suwonensis]
MKGSLGIAGGLLLALAAMPAGAATLYRCVGEDGVASYVNRKIPGTQCRVFQHYVPERKGSRPKVASAPASQAPRVVPASAAGTAPTMVPAAARSDAIVPAPLPAASAPAAGAAPRRRVQGQVYAYVKDGVPHYTSRPPAGGAGGVRTIAYSYMETCYACAVNPGVSFATVRLNTSAYQAEIAAAAREFGVEEAVVRAIIHAESAFNPTALSHAGAQGLMQLMPATAQRFGVADSFDAGQNIRGGVQYLAWLLKRFNGDLTLAAAGYNAGEGAVDRYRGVPPYSETQRYVQRVAVLAERYRGVLAAR